MTPCPARAQTGRLEDPSRYHEPEASLHPDLMEPLARLVAHAADRTQIWLVTHSTRLADAIAARGVGHVRQVVRADGETRIEGLEAWGEFDEDD